MATVYSEFDCTAAELVATLKTKVLLSGDWADIGPSSQLNTSLNAISATNTTLTLGTAAATNATGLSVGDVIVLDRGLGTEERLTISTRSSTTLLSYSSSPAVFAHSAGATIHYGAILLKATCVNTAQLVVDLAAAVSSNSVPLRATLSVYRSHDGTTGVDKVPRYINWRSTGGASTDVLHCTVSAGKEHLWISVEGPRAGETNAVSATNGSRRETFALSSLVPYFDTDTVPTVVLMAHLGTGSNNDPYCHVSRNSTDTSSWVLARLGTVTVATSPTGVVTFLSPCTLAQNALLDANTYFFPFVVVEQANGLRGRLQFLAAGYSAAALSNEPLWTPGQKATIGGATHTACPVGRDASVSTNTPFGGYRVNTDIQMVMVPS